VAQSLFAQFHDVTAHRVFYSNVVVELVSNQHSCSSL